MRFRFSLRMIAVLASLALFPVPSIAQQNGIDSYGGSATQGGSSAKSGADSTGTPTEPAAISMIGGHDCAPIWQSQSACTASCGGGYQTVYWQTAASCSQGAFVTTKPCNTQACTPYAAKEEGYDHTWAPTEPTPVDTAGQNVCASTSQADACSATCGGGVQVLHWTTASPCSAAFDTVQACNTQACPVTETWMLSWGDANLAISNNYKAKGDCVTNNCDWVPNDLSYHLQGSPANAAFACAASRPGGQLVTYYASNYHSCGNNNTLVAWGSVDAPVWGSQGGMVLVGACGYNPQAIDWIECTRTY